MQKYRCHKIVEAQDLADKHVSCTLEDGGAIQVFIDGEKPMLIPAKAVSSLSAPEIEDGYLVRYSDGYISWSPRRAFEEGYAAIPPDASHGGDGKPAY